MHDAVIEYVSAQVAAFNLDEAGDVLDIGGRDVNGTTRRLFPNAAYVTVDIVPHESVDVVADAADLDLGREFDVVVSTECLEHAQRASMIVESAFRHLRPGGMFIATMAGPGRRPHGAGGAPKPPPGEWYCNVYPCDLSDWLEHAGFVEFNVDQLHLDVRCWAIRPEEGC